jgi:hypothetical protein
MRACWLSVLLACYCFAPLVVGAAEFDLEQTRIIRHIPRTDAELAALHMARADLACEAIEAGLPLEVIGFNEPVSHRNPAASGDAPAVTVLESSRRSVLSFGMRMTPDDQRELPLLSGGKILQYVDQTYIALQARVERDSPGGEPFLHFRPTAIQGDYSNRRTATAFSSMLRESVGQVRGLGLFLKPGITPAADNLRTLVALHASLADDARQAELESKGVTGRTLHYELLCLRARVGGHSTERQVTLHGFATTDDRSRLRYLHPYRTPSKATDCTLQSTIFFTSYGFANLYPTAKTTRRLDVDVRATFTLADLDRYVASQGWGCQPGLGRRRAGESDGSSRRHHRRPPALNAPLPGA